MNCAEMRVSPEWMLKQSLHTVQSMVWEYNERHRPPEEQEPAEAPDADFVARRMQRLADMGLARSIH